MRKISIGITTISLLLTFSGTAFAAPMTTSQQSYNQATISWQQLPNVTCYKIYYKESGAQKWQHAVHCKNLPPASQNYEIKYLKKGVAYTYKVVAVVNGKEISMGEKQIANISSMQ